MNLRVLVCVFLATTALAGCADDPVAPDDAESSTTSGSPTGSTSGTPTEGGSPTDPSTDGGASSGPSTTSSTSGTSIPTATSSTATSTSSTAPARAPVTWDVVLAGGAFGPSSLTVQVGDTVRWTHADGPLAVHSVTADDGSFDSHPGCAQVSVLGIGLVWNGCMGLGGMFEHTFAAPGTVSYRSTPEPEATGAVTVLARYDASP